MKGGPRREKNLFGEVASASQREGKRGWGKKKKSKKERRGVGGRERGGRIKIRYVRDRASEIGSRSDCVVGRPENALVGVGLSGRGE